MIAVYVVTPQTPRTGLQPIVKGSWAKPVLGLWGVITLQVVAPHTPRTGLRRSSSVGGGRMGS